MGTDRYSSYRAKVSCWNCFKKILTKVPIETAAIFLWRFQLARFLFSCRCPAAPATSGNKRVDANDLTYYYQIACIHFKRNDQRVSFPFLDEGQINFICNSKKQMTFHGSKYKLLCVYVHKTTQTIYLYLIFGRNSKRRVHTYFYSQ